MFLWSMWKNNPTIFPSCYYFSTAAARLQSPNTMMLSSVWKKDLSSIVNHLPSSISKNFVSLISFRHRIGTHVTLDQDENTFHWVLWPVMEAPVITPTFVAVPDSKNWSSWWTALLWTEMYVYWCCIPRLREEWIPEPPWEGQMLLVEVPFYTGR